MIQNQKIKGKGDNEFTTVILPRESISQRKKH